MFIKRYMTTHKLCKRLKITYLHRRDPGMEIMQLSNFEKWIATYFVCQNCKRICTDILFLNDDDAAALVWYDDASVQSFRGNLRILAQGVRNVKILASSVLCCILLPLCNIHFRLLVSFCSFTSSVKPKSNSTTSRKNLIYLWHPARSR